MLQSKVAISSIMFISKKISELSELEIVFLAHLGGGEGTKLNWDAREDFGSELGNISLLFGKWMFSDFL